MSRIFDNVERVTKKFYREFQQQHAEFLDLLEGIDDERERRRYASVLLDRLMFVYFLQRQRFIDDDDDYLRTKLRESRAFGADLYYRRFLHRLFRVGFASPAKEWSAEDRKLLGKVPFLGGELFPPHSIEQRHPCINVPDRAFENLYHLFTNYSWNLDDAPRGRANEINPDVLGYIFEKRVNRKAFGAYYTRPEITQYLCEQTIYNLILDRVNSIAPPPATATETGVSFTEGYRGSFIARRYESISGLLSNLDAPLCRYLLDEVLPGLKLLDPAAGSGAFLVAALKTLMNVYSEIIARIESLGDSSLLRRLERLRAGRTSLNYYIKRRILADNLYGVDIMEESREVTRLRLFLALIASAHETEELQTLPDIDSNILAGNALIGLIQVDDKDCEAFGARGDIGAQRREARVALDGVLLREFVRLGIKFEQPTWDEKQNREGKPEKRAVTLADIAGMQPFHWGYEFARILGEGGFHGIITNPPWDIFQTDEKEFFRQYEPAIRKKKLRIEDWKNLRAEIMKDAALRTAWLDYASGFPHVSKFLKAAPQYKNQLSNVNGKSAGSKINLSSYFIEQCFNLLRPGGRCGIVVPSNIYTDLGAKQLREMLFTETSVNGLFCFENRKTVFEGVHRSYKFAVLTFEKGGSTDTFPAAFMRTDVAELQRFPQQGTIRLDVDFIRRLSPDSLSIMEFKSEMDIQVAEKMLRFPLLSEHVEDAWNLTLTQDFNMTTDSFLFKKSAGAGRVPLYEGKMIHQFDHRFSSPRYWVIEKEGRRALRGRNPDEDRKLDYENYRVAFRTVGENTNARNFISAVIPRRAFCGNSISLSQNVNENSGLVLALCAMFNSFILDYAVRLKISRNMSMFYVMQLPVPRLTEKDTQFARIVERAARLVCTSQEFDGLARAVGLGGHSAGAIDAAERARLRAELDGLIARLYGLNEAEFGHVLSTFPRVPSEVREAALAEFRREALEPRARNVKLRVRAKNKAPASF